MSIHIFHQNFTDVDRKIAIFCPSTFLRARSSWHSYIAMAILSLSVRLSQHGTIWRPGEIGISGF